MISFEIDEMVSESSLLNGLMIMYAEEEEKERQECEERKKRDL